MPHTVFLLENIYWLRFTEQKIEVLFSRVIVKSRPKIQSQICLILILYIQYILCADWLFISKYSPQRGFPGGSVIKNPRANARDADLIPEWGRSPGEGSILAQETPWTEEPGRRQPTGLRKGWTRLNDQTATARKKNVNITPFVSHPMLKKLTSTEYFFPRTSMSL